VPAQRYWVIPELGPHDGSQWRDPLRSSPSRATVTAKPNRTLPGSWIANGSCHSTNRWCSKWLVPVQASNPCGLYGSAASRWRDQRQVDLSASGLSQGWL